MEAGRLGALLMQFPWSFKNDSDSRAYVLELARRFRDYPLVLEVRHASWTDEGVLDLLAEHDIGICNIDQPLFKRSIRPDAPGDLTGRLRSLASPQLQTLVFAEGECSRAIRSSVLREELEPWVDRIQQIAKDAKDTYAVANNHNVGKVLRVHWRSRRCYGR